MPTRVRVCRTNLFFNRRPDYDRQVNDVKMTNSHIDHLYIRYYNCTSPLISKSMQIILLTTRIQHVMKNREAFDLGGASSKLPINLIFWWETGLAIFSIVGAYYVVPGSVQSFFNEGWVQGVCRPGALLNDRTGGYWVFVFTVSWDVGNPRSTVLYFCPRCDI